LEENDLKDFCLIEIEKLLQSNNRSLKEFFTMSYPEMCTKIQYVNKFVVDELNYNTNELKQTCQNLLLSLTNEQHNVYQQTMEVVMTDNGGLFFLYGYGENKTFIWNTLSIAMRVEGFIVLNVVSSGIASLLLPRGRTTHFVFFYSISHQWILQL